MKHGLALAAFIHWNKALAAFRASSSPSLFYVNKSSLFRNMSSKDSESESAPKKPRLEKLPEQSAPILTDDDVLAKKKALRKEIRAAIKKDLNAEAIKIQSAKVWEKVIDLPVYQSAKSVGLFLSMPSGEINTDEILKHAIKNGKAVYVPEVGENFEKCDMELRKVILDSETSSDNDEIFHKKWPKNKWKIPEPPKDMPAVNAKQGDIALLIVPGLGFDRTRSRIGQGKGYYDRFIARMTTDETPMPLIAVGLTPQLVETSIPVADYDRKMDMVVLPDETIE